MASHELDGPCVGIGAASIDLEGAASEGAASMPAPPGVAVGIGGADAADDSGVGGSSQEEVVDNGPCGVKPALPGGADAIDHVLESKCPGISHKDEELEGAASIELGGAASMPAPPVGGADAVDMGGGGCTMAGGAAALGVPPSGAVRGSAFSCSTSSGAAPGGGAPWWAPWQVLGVLGVLHLPAVLLQALWVEVLH